MQLYKCIYLCKSNISWCRCIAVHDLSISVLEIVLGTHIYTIISVCVVSFKMSSQKVEIE